MRRTLSVWLPTFSTDLLKRRFARRPAGEPGDRKSGPHAIILTRPVASREVVVRRCETADRAGVRDGMNLAHARSLLPAGTVLHTEPHRPDRDEAALHALACWALRFSPRVCPDPPDGLLIDSTGTERLHRGEARLLGAVASGVYRLGFQVRVASASTFGCAWGFARFGQHSLSRVPPGRERDAMGRLPVGALRVDERTVKGLAALGITGVSDVLNLPRASLAARFDGALLLRVRQALGETDEPIEPVRPAPPLRCGLVFDGPTEHWESVERAARDVLDDLGAQLSRQGRGVRRLDAELLRPRAAPTTFRIDLARPSRATAHLWSLLRARLERVDLGEGVEGVSLIATRTARLRHEQGASAALGGEDAEATAASWGELTDVLVGRLGADHVVHLEAVETHLPERAFRERSVMESPPRAGPAPVTRADRPSTLWRRPEPAEAMAVTPDGPILSLGWRGRRWRIVSCIGPERIAQEWWRWRPAGRGPTPGAAPPDRDYFAVQTEEGRWLWVFRHFCTSRWFVQGEWS